MVNESKYKKALSLKEEGLYEEAREILSDLNDYKEAKSELYNVERTIQKKEKDKNEYEQAIEHINKKEYNSAIIILKSLNDYKDSKALIEQAETAQKEDAYIKAVEHLNKKEYGIAIAQFSGMSEYKDSKELIEKAQKELYSLAEAKLKAKDYDNAKDYYSILGDYSDSKEKMNKTVELETISLAKTGKFYDAFCVSRDGNKSFNSIMNENGFSKQLAEFKNDFNLYKGEYYASGPASIGASGELEVNTDNWSFSFLGYNCYYCFEKEPVYHLGHCSATFSKNNGKYTMISVIDEWDDTPRPVHKYNRIGN